MKASILHRQTFIVTIIIMAILTLAGTSYAHRLNVFAWLEDDDVIVECNFGMNHPARGAEVTIFDTETKKELLRGKTNETGHFKFKVPNVVREGHGLAVSVDAGAGHHGEWVMDAAEIYSAASLTAGFDAARLESRDNAGKKTPPPSPSAASLPGDNLNVAIERGSQAAAPASLSADHVRSIVRETVESTLAPIRKQLASQSAREPGWIEIIGGIGWIIGLAGIVLYFMSRRSRQD